MYNISSCPVLFSGAAGERHFSPENIPFYYNIFKISNSLFRISAMTGIRLFPQGKTGFILP